MRLAAATALGAAAALAGIGLLATASWLVVRASEQPNVAALGVAIAGVRFFGVARGVLRYTDRLVSHDTALRALAAERTRSFGRLEPLAPLGLPAFRSGDLLARLVDDVDSVQDRLLRVVQPFAVAAVAGGLAVVLLWWLAAAIRDVAKAGRRRRLRALFPIAGRTLTVAAMAYLAFLVAWGLNYRRVPLREKLMFEAGRVSAPAAVALLRRDVERLNTLYVDAHRTLARDEGSVDPDLARAFDQARRELENPHAYYLVAVDDDAEDPEQRLLGYAGLLAPPDGGQGDIQTIAVAEFARGIGLGRGLMHALITAARRKHVAEVFLEVRAENTAAIRLYERTGFEVTGRRPGYYGRGADAIVMRCWLSDMT